MKRIFWLIACLIFTQNYSYASPLYLSCIPEESRKKSSEYDTRTKWVPAVRESEFELSLFENNSKGSIWYPPDKNTIKIFDSVGFLPKLIFFTQKNNWSDGRFSNFEFFVNRSDGTFLKKSNIDGDQFWEQKGRCYKTKPKNNFF